jgi:hypothetical protein
LIVRQTIGGRRIAARRTAAAFALAGCLALLGPHGSTYGQADQPLMENVELVGHSDLGGRGLNGSVWAHRDAAYVGTWGPRSNNPALCLGRGVTIVDIADPRRPAVVGSVAERPGTSAEDVQVIAVSSPAFRGDLLATGIQRCASNVNGGLSLWDVTDPRKPAELGFFEIGGGPVGVHEFSMFRRGPRVIALLAVPFSELVDPEQQGDLRIVDISDPRAPVLISHWGLNRALGVAPRQGVGRDAHNYAHSVRTSPDGQLAYVSYWDAGVVILDISDLASPRYLGRTTFGPDEEGNAHSTALAKGGRVLVEADEDIFVRSEALEVEGVASLPLVHASYGAFRPVLQETGGVSGSAVYVGRGCPAEPHQDGAPAANAEPYFADPHGRVAIVDRGDCTFVDKVLRAQRSGALAVIIADREATPVTPDGAVQELTIPAALISRDSADRLKEALGRGDAVTIRFSPDRAEYDDWGYLRFWDVADPANPVLVATFATEHARTDRETGPVDDGWYTVHHPVVLGDRLYASWYSDGVRVLDIADPTRPREVGFFIPPRGQPQPGQLTGHVERPFVWGVYVRGDLLLASDYHTGLYILRDQSR